MTNPNTDTPIHRWLVAINAAWASMCPHVALQRLLQRRWQEPTRAEERALGWFE
ncbi:MAG: hypothetical protein ACRD0A_17850 [Acidimicrobiales bacterium]